MFIATADPTTPSSVGAKCDSPDIFRSYGAGPPLIPGVIVYKHFVPTGLKSLFQQAILLLDRSNKLNGALPTVAESGLYLSR